MKILNKIVDIKTNGLFDFIDITDELISLTEESQILNGILNVQTMHTTAMIMVNENEPLLIEDIKKNLEKIAPSTDDYQHDNFEIRKINLCDDECDNGHSHCKAIHLLPSATLNILDGRLQLGDWQRVIFVELDRPRERRYQIQVMGE
ncbi:MAG: secondary thiamine-phosphate synthase enzyme YjbQ [Minisyncoccales bacterium]|jgi:secondary thiamine-phosphate synthase enzyme